MRQRDSVVDDAEELAHWSRSRRRSNGDADFADMVEDLESGNLGQEDREDANADDASAHGRVEGQTVGAAREGAARSSVEEDADPSPVFNNVS